MKKLLTFFACALFISFALNQALALQAAPDFTLKDLKGNKVTLSSYKDKQAVMLFFWTTRCPYCMSELRLLKEKASEMAKDGCELFTIDVGEPDYRVVNFVQKQGFTFTVLLDQEYSATDAFGVFGVPTYILIDKAGNIILSAHNFPDKEYKGLFPK